MWSRRRSSRAFSTIPRIALDNNATERALRGMVLGRKNHYGSRSQRGTEVAALFYSLIESAKLCGAEPKAYLLCAATAALRNPGAVTLPHDLLMPAWSIAVRRTSDVQGRSAPARRHVSSSTLGLSAVGKQRRRSKRGALDEIADAEVRGAKAGFEHTQPKRRISRRELSLYRRAQAQSGMSRKGCGITLPRP
jgi:Transposase IS66 family